MSTKFTRSAMKTIPPAPLTVLFQTASQWILQGLLSKLKNRGYENITEAHILLLGNLDCGATYASEVAHRMRISRQAVFRTVRELESLKILVLENDSNKKNQKLVVMTEKGNELILNARKDLEEIETVLAARVGKSNLQSLREILESDWGISPVM